MKFLDIKHELTEDFFMCLYAFGDKEDGTGFVRARDCPGKGSSRTGSFYDVTEVTLPIQFKSVTNLEPIKVRMKK